MASQRALPGRAAGVVAALYLLAGCTIAPEHTPAGVALPCPAEMAHTVSERFAPAIGRGPVYAAGFSDEGVLSLSGPDGGFAGSDWDGQKVLWIIDPGYHGPVQIRGQRLDAVGDMRFDDPPLADTIRIDALDGTDTFWRDRPSFTRVQAPGCYAYEVTGQGFQYTIVFAARTTGS